MSTSPCVKHIGLSLVFVAASCLPARATTFVSPEHAFQVTIPEGFGPWQSYYSNRITEYIEANPGTGIKPVAIDIRQVPAVFNIADETIDSNLLPRQKGWSYSYETRRWKKKELRVVRQEIAFAPSDKYVVYLIAFPFADEGIVIRVKGPLDREKDVLKTFNETFPTFFSLKPDMIVENQRIVKASNSIVEILIKVLLSLVSVALIGVWIAKVRAARVKAAGTTAEST